MQNIPFKKAERKQSKLRLGLNGPSGSGKTHSALLIAKGISKKRIAVIDTEKGSASLYSHLFDFDTAEIEPPFSPEKYIQTIELAEKSGLYDLLIIDSFSHAWMGEGGILDQKALLDQKPGSNQFANWKKPKESYARLKNAILFSPLHIICTFRAKQSHEQVIDEHGRKKIEKMGLEPQAEPGTEYEFTTVFDIAMNHHTTVSKDRTGLFDGKIFIPSEHTGEQFYTWLMNGAPVQISPPINRTESLTPLEEVKKTHHNDARHDGQSMEEPWKIGSADFALLESLAREAGYDLKKVESVIQTQFKKTLQQLTYNEFKQIEKRLIDAGIETRRGK